MMACNALLPDWIATIVTPSNCGRDVQDRSVGELVEQSEGAPAFEQTKWQHVGMAKNAAECTSLVESVLADIKKHAMSLISGWGASIAVLAMLLALTKVVYSNYEGPLVGMAKPLVALWEVCIIFVTPSLMVMRSMAQ